MSVGYQDFRDRSERHELTVAVVGLGFTGLPLAQTVAAAGFRTLGVENAPERIGALREGRSYVPDVPDAALRAVADRLSFTDDLSVTATADAVLVCVSTPLGPDDFPDLRQLDTVLAGLTELADGALVVLQPTMPVGTSRQRAEALADRLGRTLGVDLFLGCAPERVNPAAHDQWSVRNTPRVVGGSTSECAERAASLLSAIGIPVVTVSSLEVAEMSKLVENTARLVNISLANELADVCAELGLPVAEVIGAAATKPFGYLPHWPGAGIGGECIPVDPVFLLTARPGQGERLLPLVSVARRQALRRPGKVVERVQRLLAEQDVAPAGARVLVLGVAYKADMPDLRNAPALSVISGLCGLGVEVAYCDPFIPSCEVDGQRYASLDVDELELAAWDCVVLVTPHSIFADAVKLDEARCVLDCTSSQPRSASLYHL